MFRKLIAVNISATLTRLALLVAKNGRIKTIGYVKDKYKGQPQSWPLAVENVLELWHTEIKNTFLRGLKSGVMKLRLSRLIYTL